MASTTETKLKGRVISYQVRPTAKRVDEKSKGVTVTKAARVSAKLEIRVDDTTYFVPAVEILAGDTTTWLDSDTEPGSDIYKQVFNTTVAAHPPGSECAFSMFEKKVKGRTYRWYELDED